MITMITAKDFADRTGSKVIADGTAQYNSLIRAAHVAVQSYLDTKFDFQSNTDLFLLDAGQTGGVIPNRRFKLRLRNGFVRATPAPVLTYGINWSDPTTFQPVPTTDYRVDFL